MSKSKKTKTRQSNSTCDPGKQRPGKAGPRAMRVEVKRINFYDKNPRHSKNPEYDRIKASILASGMDQPSLITQRPGDADYFVQAGATPGCGCCRNCTKQPAMINTSGLIACTSNGIVNQPCCWLTCAKTNSAAI